MYQSLKLLFTAHPDSVGEGYFEHFTVALSYAGWLFVAAFCALCHAFLPFCFEKTASNIIKKMAANIAHRQMNDRRH